MTAEPAVSIVVPTYERPRQLTRCLEAVANLENRGQSFEVIVVDDGSRAPLESAVASFADRVNVILVRQPNAGPAAARNTGVTRARARHVVFLDDDCTPDTQWLQALAARFAKDPESAVAGRTINALPDNVFSTATQLLVERVCEYYNVAAGGPTFFPSNNLAVPRDAFQAAGGFNTSFAFAGGEDRDFCDRWIRHGFRLSYAPDAVVYHAHFMTLRAFWKQHFTYGRGAYYFNCTHPDRRMLRIDSRRLNFYLKLPVAPFSAPGQHRALPVAAALVVSQFATVAGFLREVARRDPRADPAPPG